jgi:hypothetical protein
MQRLQRVARCAENSSTATFYDQFPILEQLHLKRGQVSFDRFRIEIGQWQGLPNYVRTVQTEISDRVCGTEAPFREVTLDDFATVGEPLECS